MAQDKNPHTIHIKPTPGELLVAIGIASVAAVFATVIGLVVIGISLHWLFRNHDEMAAWSIFYALPPCLFCGVLSFVFTFLKIRNYGESS